MAIRKSPAVVSEGAVKSSRKVECPICGAPVGEGGCSNPGQCFLSVATIQQETGGGISAEQDEQQQRQSFRLMMAGFEALDLLNVGLLVTTADGVVLIANRTAEQILEARDGLELTAGGQLRTAPDGLSFSDFLQQSLTEAARGKSGSRNAVLAVPRSSGKRALTLLCRRAPSRVSPPGPMAPAALLFVLDPGSPVQAAESDLRELYGLTSSEARLANLLMEGKTLNECCDALQIRRSTGRTHLQHLFEKVGVQRQSELVFLLLKSIGLVRATNRNFRKNSGPGLPTSVKPI